mgnify:FL=1
MVATNMGQLEQMLRTKLKVAMQSASDNINSDITKNLSSFYTQGTPKIYKRTGNLGGSAERTPLSCVGNTVSFEAKLNTTHGYTTGTYSKTEVLEAAENHEHGVLGKSGVWAKSEGNMQKLLDSAIRSQFH